MEVETVYTTGKFWVFQDKRREASRMEDFIYVSVSLQFTRKG